MEKVANEAIRLQQQQVDHLNSENLSLTEKINKLEGKDQEQRIQISMYETNVQLIQMKSEEKDLKIKYLTRENLVLKAQLEKQFQNEDIAQLALRVMADLHYNNSHCEHCQSTQRELEVVRRDYDQVKTSIEELREENSHFKCKLRDLQTNRLHQTAEIQREVKEAIERSNIQQISIDSSHKRQMDEGSYPTSKPKRACHQKDNATKGFSNKEADSSSEAKAESNISNITPDQASTPRICKKNQSCNPRTITTTAQIHPEPVKHSPCRSSNFLEDDNITDEGDKSSERNPAATDTRHEPTYGDIIYIGDDTIISKGEKTIINDRLEILERIERRRNSADRNADEHDDSDEENEDTSQSTTASSRSRDQQAKRNKEFPLKKLEQYGEKVHSPSSKKS